MVIRVCYENKGRIRFLVRQAGQSIPDQRKRFPSTVKGRTIHFINDSQMSGTWHMWETVMRNDLSLLVVVEPGVAFKQGVAMIIFDF